MTFFRRVNPLFAIVFFFRQLIIILDNVKEKLTFLPKNEKENESPEAEVIVTALKGLKPENFQLALIRYRLSGNTLVNWQPPCRYTRLRLRDKRSSNAANVLRYCGSPSQVPRCVTASSTRS